MAGSGGRPTAAEAALLGDRIVAAAADMFLRDGYAATSVEAIASQAGVSKRTFYARFDGKAAVFLDVVRWLIRDWLSGFDHTLDVAATLEDALLTISRKMLDVALRPEALQLHALITAEVMRVPEIANALRSGGGDAGMQRFMTTLRRFAPGLPADVVALAAEQFQGMVIYAPQRRAMGLGPALDGAARERWCRACVAVLLHGILQSEPAATLG